MDVAIDTGADAPAPTALELTAPADTPAYLSTHDAAAVLRKLRQPKANDTTTTDPARANAAAPEPGKESTAADAADDAAPVDAQDPGAKTEGTDPGATELSPIEPPRSWNRGPRGLRQT
jgi:hypothetical protein